MSMPYGGGAAPQQPMPHAQPAAQPMNIGAIVAMAAAGLGLVLFFFSFSEAVLFTQRIMLIVASAALAGLSLLPKAPKLLWAAVTLSIVGFLDFIVGWLGNSPIDIERGALFYIALFVAFLQLAAVVVALLFEVEIIKIEPKPAMPYGPPGGWNPQSGGFQQQQQPFGNQQGYYGAPQGQPHPGQFGQPQQPQAGQFGQQPPHGQFGQAQQPQATQQFHPPAQGSGPDSGPSPEQQPGQPNQ